MSHNWAGLFAVLAFGVLFVFPLGMWAAARERRQGLDAGIPAELQRIADRLAALPGSERVRGRALLLASDARCIADAVEVLAVVIEDERRANGKDG